MLMMISSLMASPDLTLLYDGTCPLCVREVRFLQKRDRHQHLAFVDIDASDYDPSAHGGIGYRQAMGSIHAIDGSGTVLRDVAVFREAYRLVGLGWVYRPTRLPVIAPLVDALYGAWAARRLQITGRPDLDSLCRDREGCKTSGSGCATNS